MIFELLTTTTRFFFYHYLRSKTERRADESVRVTNLHRNTCRRLRNINLYNNNNNNKNIIIIIKQQQQQQKNKRTKRTKPTTTTTTIEERRLYLSFNHHRAKDRQIAHSLLSCSQSRLVSEMALCLLLLFCQSRKHRHLQRSSFECAPLQGVLD